jgi:ubiquinone/menaquinone biosynthesis C-methylase UbiE
MNLIESTLKGIDGGRVLDVATQDGHFVQVLAKYLKSFVEIVGIDLNNDAIETAQNTCGSENIQFQVMDAEHLDFEDACFDTVTISASLHHLSNIPQVLSEMVRVLKPGGYFILVEMHRDGHTEAERTTVYLHQWVAAVDSALGHLHNSLLARQEFVDYIAVLELSESAFYDHSEPEADPKEKAWIEQLDNLISRTIQRAGNASNYGELRERGEQLRQRLHKIGAQREPVILILGKK